MILNTGSRTDIPAFYSEWFLNRLRAGEVLVCNPYYPEQVTRYRIAPDVVDAIVFCTKDPAPLLRAPAAAELLEPYETFWFFTITPYGREVEPRVPDKDRAIDSFLRLSELFGPERTSWRYDPIFLSERYSLDFHVERFARMAARLRGATSQCVISFIDLYGKTRRNFPGVRAVTPEQQEAIVEAFAPIAAECGMHIHLCCEDARLARPGVDAEGCLSQGVLEEALGVRLRVPARKSARPECACLLGADIGAYNSCGHGCRYCYANYDQAAVRRSMAQHDPASPLLIGHVGEGDQVRDARQASWIDPQPALFDL